MSLENLVRERRRRAGWSQADLARRAGVSRAGISAIETGRLVPSAAVALALAAGLDCQVEDLFRLGPPHARDPGWAWPAIDEPARYWHAAFGRAVRLYPVEPTAAGVASHDGIAEGGALRGSGRTSPDDTLVVACCDPAAGLLVEELARARGYRLLIISRSSQEALRLLGRGLVHAAGIHLARRVDGADHVTVVRRSLGSEFRLLRMARWEESLALAPGVGVSSVRAAIRARLRWVGRETGSGARQRLDELLAGRPMPRRMARDHRGVADAIRCGWADAGVLVRLAGVEAGLRVLGLRNEVYDWCIPEASTNDPRIRALMEVVRSRSYRRLLAELPGYDASDTGSVRHVA